MPTLIIEANSTERQYWRDLWQYRELFYFLAWRDVLIRYKQTIAGTAWAIIRPLATTAVLTVVFGVFGQMPSGGVPYALVVFCGSLPWQFFSTALSESGMSLITSSNLVSKIYFPRMIIPTSTIVTSFVDFVIFGACAVPLMLWFRFLPPAQIIWLPVFAALTFLASLGAGLWISALMVKYRDFRFIVPFVVQFGLYISPVGFSSSVVPARWRLLYSLNPMVGVIDGFRWSILGAEHSLYWPSIVSSVTGIGILLLTGIWYFRRTEQTFADII